MKLVAKGLQNKEIARWLGNKEKNGRLSYW
ncbi:MAG: hypothetical protein ACYC21_08070 [Eubacteriales bacterium]